MEQSTPDVFEAQTAELRGRVITVFTDNFKDSEHDKARDLVRRLKKSPDLLAVTISATVERVLEMDVFVRDHKKADTGFRIQKLAAVQQAVMSLPDDELIELARVLLTQKKEKFEARRDGMSEEEAKSAASSLLPASLVSKGGVLNAAIRDVRAHLQMLDADPKGVRNSIRWGFERNSATPEEVFN